LVVIVVYLSTNTQQHSNCKSGSYPKADIGSIRRFSAEL